MTLVWLAVAVGVCERNDSGGGMCMWPMNDVIGIGWCVCVCVFWSPCLVQVKVQ